MSDNTEETTRLREVLRTVRLDLWTVMAQSSHHEKYKYKREAIYKINAELGSVSTKEWLETVFPKPGR